MQFTSHQRIAFRLFALAFALVMFWQMALQAKAAPFTPTRFTVAVDGQGPDVIMIPGLASSSAVWRPEASRLKARYRVHLIQVNGFAGTPPGANANGNVIAATVDELAAYIRAHKLRPAVIGHSMGGLMGLILAIKHPDTVAKLMVVDSLPFFGVLFGPDSTVQSVEPRAAATRDKVLAGTQADYAASQPTTMATMIKTPGPELQAAIVASQKSDYRVVARAIYEDIITDTRGDLAKINVPATILYAFDPSVGYPQDAVDGIYASGYATMPNKRLVRIENSRHFIQIDQPEIFDREVQTFLAH